MENFLFINFPREMHRFLFQSYFAGSIIRLIQVAVEAYTLYATIDSELSSINLYRMFFVWHFILAAAQLPIRVPIYLELKRMARLTEQEDLVNALLHLNHTRLWKIHASLGFLLYLKSTIGVCLFFIRLPSDWNTAVFHIMVSETAVEMGRYITSYYRLRKITSADAPDPFERFVVAKGAVVDEISEFTQLRQFGHLSDEERAQSMSAGCPICFGEYEDAHMVRRLVCHHLFHSECIEEWLMKKKVCPKCHHPINKPFVPTGAASSRSCPASERGACSVAGAEAPASGSSSSASDLSKPSQGDPLAAGGVNPSAAEARLSASSSIDGSMAGGLQSGQACGDACLVSPLFHTSDAEGGHRGGSSSSSSSTSGSVVSPYTQHSPTSSLSQVHSQAFSPLPSAGDLDVQPSNVRRRQPASSAYTGE